MVLSDISIRRPVLAIVMNLVIVLIGIICYDRLAVRLIPNVDVPVVTVFGPTHPEWTEIYFEKERKVAVKVFCGPCQKKICPLDHRCMTRVTPGMVHDAAMQLLPHKQTVQLPVI